MARDIIHAFPTGDDVAKAVADRFLTYTNECIAETGEQSPDGDADSQ